MKKIPEAANMGIYPRDWVTNPALNTEANSASLMGMCSYPISTETVGLFLVTLAMIDSKKPIPRPCAKASARKSAGM